ncbi:nuclear movement protein nudC [Verticillium alfalfae VaMs.102]|uniref:Nuclear movement protein nudC n=1 Tax=Verticillium alfalfae (strain VaMs.102 / ATCC MYA-4576 / FGSC 10136) TaxID=526221 RepID=C9SQH0_VERA1|nr:nuclear movement protein nudC [Verticillium alfalfae VaMs.102]EEY21095.1 nuclear movement protein nudC [Verticillium alfalfae VaMs.102]
MRFRAPKTDEEKAAREKQNAEQAALPYKWFQQLETLQVEFDVPLNYKAKDLVIDFKRTSFKAGIKGQTLLIDGDFPHPIRVDESTWGMTPNAAKDAKTVTIHLDKTNKMEWWANIVTNQPSVDLTMIEPEETSLSDVTEGSTRAMAEKMMWESTLTPEQKQKNKQEENMKRLAELQKQTGLDFSQAEINHG